MKKSLSIIAIILAVIAGISNLLLDDIVVDLHVSIATIVNVHLGIVLIAAITCGLITALISLRRWLIKLSDEKFASTSYNMLRVRLLLDYSISLPRYQFLGEYKFKRGDPLKFLVKDVHWQDAYSRFKGQIETAYCVDTKEAEVGGYAYVV